MLVIKERGKGEKVRECYKQPVLEKMPEHTHKQTMLRCVTCTVSPGRAGVHSHGVA